MSSSIKKTNDKIIIKLNETENTTRIFFNITSTIFILIPPILGIIWLEKIKKIECKCSDISWYKKYITFYFIFIIIYTILLLISTFFLNKYDMLKSRIMISIILFIYNLVSYFIIIYYIYKLKKIDCKCSEMINREIVYIWYIILFIFGALTLPLFLYGAYLFIKFSK